MLGQLERCIEDRVHRIADDLIDHAAASGNDAGDEIEIRIEKRNEVAGIRPLAHCGKALDVGEHRGDVAKLALQPQPFRLGSDPADNLRHEVLLEARTQQARAPLLLCESCVRRSGKGQQHNRRRSRRIGQETRRSPRRQSHEGPDDGQDQSNHGAGCGS
jgi:hypothetical protein